MKRIRIVGLCLVAVFAMSVVASSASAAPVFYTKAAIGETAKPVPFTATIGAAFLEGKTSKAKISCSDTAGTGAGANGEAVTSTVAQKNVTTFTGCVTSELKCQSAGQAQGTIVTDALTAVLGSISATVPGERLYSEAEGKGGKLAEFECGGGLVKVVVTGSIVGSLSGASGKTVAEGKFAASGKLTFAEAAGKQKYQKLEGEAEEQLTSTVNGTPELGGQSVIATIKSTPASNLGETL